MRASVFVIALAASIGVSTALPAQAHAYCLRQVTGYQGTSVWPGEVSYYISDTLTDANLKAAIDAAFKAWADVACATITFKNAGTFAISDVPFQSHGKNGIYVFWYDDANKGTYPTDPKYTAYSFYGIDGAGAITQASIALNGFAGVTWSTNPAATELDLQGEMTPLVGQVIGIDKSDVADSVMTGIMATGDTSKRTLKQDDIDAVSYLYPAQGCTPPPPGTACGGTTPPQNDGGTTPPAGDGGTTPPAGDGGTTPPAGDGGTTPPTSDGGTTPPAGDFGTTPPGGCTNDNQCGSGQYCSEDGTCKQKADDGGCCAVAAERPPLTAVLLALAFAALLGVGRRRRR